MAPTLFNIIFSTLVIYAFHDCDASFCFAYKRFNLRWLQDKTKVQNGGLDKRLYVDVRSKNAKTDRNMPRAINSFTSQ